MKSANSKTIRIAVKAAAVVSLERLRIIQDDLKSLSKESYRMLRDEILSKGMCFAIHVWDDGKTLCILDGTQRYRVLSELVKEGWKLPGVPVNFIEAENEKDAVLKCLAGAGMYGHPEAEGLYALMAKHGLSMADIPNIELPGIDMPTFEAEFFKDEYPDDGSEDEVPETPKEARVKTGELYILGSHRLLCGDSTKKEDVERLMGGERADTVYTDPPYGMRLEANRFAEVSPQAAGMERTEYRAADWDQEDFRFEDFAWLDIPEQFWWGANYYCQNLPRGGSWFVWDKKAETQANLPGGDFELCWSRREHAIWMIRHMWTGFTAKERGEKRVHPTQKPVALAEMVIDAYGGQAILDLFLGSGSTLIACEKTQRRCFGCEIDPLYVAVVLDRWEKFSGKRAVREDGTPWVEIRGGE